MEKKFKKYFKNILIQIIIISIIYTEEIKKYIIIDFKKIYNNSNEFIEKNYINYLDTEIKIGSNNETLPLGITFNSYGTFLFSSKLKNANNVIIFDETKSKTFKMKDELQISDTYYLMGNICIDSMLLANNLFNNYTFILADNVNGEYIFHLNGKIGLRLTTNNYYDEDYEANIFYQLRKYKIIKNNLFYFEFNNNKNDFNGKLILGIYPHELDPLKYNKSNLTFFKINKFEGSYELYFYCHKFLKILIYDNNNQIKYSFKNNTVLFDIDFGLIKGTDEYHNYIKSNFFNELLKDSKCFSYKYRDYTFYKCNPNINLNNFESLYFYIDEESYLLLDKFDLFINYNNYLYFIIGFTKKSDYWNLGVNIFKKYTLVFNIDQKEIGFYKFNNIQNDFNNNSETNTVIITKIKYIKNGNIFLIFIIIFLILIIIFLLKLLYEKFIILRKDRPNELKERFDYFTSDNNSNNKLIKK